MQDNKHRIHLDVTALHAAQRQEAIGIKANRPLRHDTLNAPDY